MQHRLKSRILFQPCVAKKNNGFLLQRLQLSLNLGLWNFSNSKKTEPKYRRIYTSKVKMEENVCHIEGSLYLTTKDA